LAHELLLTRNGADMHTHVTQSRGEVPPSLVLAAAELFISCPQDYIPSFFDCV